MYVCLLCFFSDQKEREHCITVHLSPEVGVGVNKFSWTAFVCKTLADV